MAAFVVYAFSSLTDNVVTFHLQSFTYCNNHLIMTFYRRHQTVTGCFVTRKKYRFLKIPLLVSLQWSAPTKFKLGVTYVWHLCTSRSETFKLLPSKNVAVFHFTTTIKLKNLKASKATVLSCIKYVTSTPFLPEKLTCCSYNLPPSLCPLSLMCHQWHQLWLCLYIKNPFLFLPPKP